MSIFKVIITLPYFFFVILKAFFWSRKIKKKFHNITEKKRYLWVKKVNKYVLWLSNIKIIVKNQHYWSNKSYIMFSNHQSYLDPSILFHLNNFKTNSPLAFLAKKELIKEKILSKFISLLDVIFIDRKSPKSAISAFIKASKLLKIPRTFLVFPEGTRSSSNKVSEFKTGVIKLLQLSFVPLIPVTIIDSYKGLKRTFFKKKIIRVIFHQPIKPFVFMKGFKKTNIDNIKKIIEQPIIDFEKNKQEK